MWKKGMFGARRPKPNTPWERIEESLNTSEGTSSQDAIGCNDSGDISVPNRGDEMSVVLNSRFDPFNTYRVRDSDGAYHDVQAEEIVYDGSIVLLVVGKRTGNREIVHLFNAPMFVQLVDLVTEKVEPF